MKDPPSPSRTGEARECSRGVRLSLGQSRESLSRGEQGLPPTIRVHPRR